MLAGPPAARGPFRRSARVAFDVFGALALFGLGYRALLWHTLAHARQPLFAYRPEHHSLPFVLRYAGGDLLLGALIALAIGAVHFAVWGVVGRLWPSLTRADAEAPSGPAAKRSALALRVGGTAALVALLGLIGLAAQAHLGVLMSMHSGLTFDLLIEALSSGAAETARETVALIDAGKALVIGSPVLLWLGMQLVPRVARPWRDRAIAGIVSAIATLNALYLLAERPALAADVTTPPLWFTVRDTLRSLSAQSTDLPLPPPPMPKPVSEGSTAATATARAPALSYREQLDSVRMDHPMFADASLPAKDVPHTRTAAWNVVLVVMESTGLHHATTPVRGRQPMPFLSRLARRSLWLENHFSPSNSSPRSLFSLFSGLYPMPHWRIYAVRGNLSFPSLFSLTRRTHRSLLVTPSSLRWYFPRGYMEHEGPDEMWGYHNLPLSRVIKGKASAKREEDTVGFFLSRLRAMKNRPFIGVYYSFAGHWPYPDQGEAYHRYPPEGRYFHYLDNLYLLDRQLERIDRFLHEQHLAERTILAVVGDHGEAFGKLHRGNYTHSRRSFNENYRTPALFYQPRLFSPRTVREATSHVDVLPTLLDAMGVSYNPRLLQGESLFQRRLRRRQIFLFGNESTLSSVNRQQVKLQLALKTRQCWVYRLDRDPLERHRRSCRHHEAQRSTLLHYMRYQQQLLRRYNLASIRDRDFFGQRHPVGRDASDPPPGDSTPQLAARPSGIASPPARSPRLVQRRPLRRRGRRTRPRRPARRRPRPRLHRGPT